LGQRHTLTDFGWYHPDCARAGTAERSTHPKLKRTSDRGFVKGRLNQRGSPRSRSAAHNRVNVLIATARRDRDRQKGAEIENLKKEIQKLTRRKCRSTSSKSASGNGGQLTAENVAMQLERRVVSAAP